MRLDPAERWTSAEEMASALAGDDATVDAGSLTVPSTVRNDAVDASATVAIPKPEQTARLPVEPARSEPAPVSRPSTVSRRAWMIAVGAIVAIAIVTALGILAFGGPDAPARSGAGSSLPAPLEDALQQLEESVRR